MPLQPSNKVLGKGSSMTPLMGVSFSCESRMTTYRVQNTRLRPDLEHGKNNDYSNDTHTHKKKNSKESIEP